MDKDQKQHEEPLLEQLRIDIGKLVSDFEAKTGVIVTGINPVYAEQVMNSKKSRLYYTINVVDARD